MKRSPDAISVVDAVFNFDTYAKPLLRTARYLTESLVEAGGGEESPAWKQTMQHDRSEFPPAPYVLRMILNELEGHLAELAKQANEGIDSES